MSQDKQPHSTHQADSIMLTLVLILAVLGLLILFSASEYNGRVRFHDSAYYFKKQLFPFFSRDFLMVIFTIYATSSCSTAFYKY